MKRGAPLVRKTPLKAKSPRKGSQAGTSRKPGQSTTKPRGMSGLRPARHPKSRAWCSVCGRARVEPWRSTEPVAAVVEVAPGWSYTVQVSGGMLVCPFCGSKTMGPTARARAERDAYEQHRQMILARDSWTCQRCGRGGPGTTIRLEVAHKVWYSRAQNPGPTKHDPENMETCCQDCHRDEHEGRA